MADYFREGKQVTVIFGLLLIPAMGGIALFVAWLAAKGYPSNWDRNTYILAFPVIEVVGAGLFYLAQHWEPADAGLFVAKEMLGYSSLLIIATGFGCCFGAITYGRLRKDPQ